MPARMSEPKRQASDSTSRSAHAVKPRPSVGEPKSSIGNRVLFRMLDAVASSVPTLQRKCACDSTSDKCESCSNDAELHRAATTSHGNEGVPPIVHDVIGTSGTPLDPATRSYFEPRFGHDLSAVRIHTDAAAGRSAQSVNALAYTVGQHVVFGADQYAHGTGEGRRVLAHELAHTIQQSSSPQAGSLASLRVSQPSDDAEREASTIADRVLSGEAAAPVEQASVDILHRVPPDEPAKKPLPDDLEDPYAIHCPPAPTDKWIKQVVVKQETPQSVTATWTDGSTDTGQCSTGKGHCCVDPAAPEGVACTERGSRTDGSNCTPITTGAGLPVLKKVPDHKGVQLWTEIDSARAIALHAYSPVDGTPLSHGCVRMNDDMACTIFNGSRVGKTMVKIEGFARPMCDHALLQAEWLGDFAKGGKDPSKADGDERGEIAETRRELNAAFGRTLTVAEIQALTAADIPKCTAKRALPVKPAAPTPSPSSAPSASEVEF